jgi:hypothetical protein
MCLCFRRLRGLQKIIDPKKISEDRAFRYFRDVIAVASLVRIQTQEAPPLASWVLICPNTT